MYLSNPKRFCSGSKKDRKHKTLKKNKHHVAKSRQASPPVPNLAQPSNAIRSLPGAKQQPLLAVPAASPTLNAAQVHNPNQYLPAAKQQPTQAGSGSLSDGNLP